MAAWTILPDGTPDFVNQNWLEYTGQSLDYVQSGTETWMSVVHPEDRERGVTELLGGYWIGKRFHCGSPLSTRAGWGLSLASQSSGGVM